MHSTEENFSKFGDHLSMALFLTIKYNNITNIDSKRLCNAASSAKNRKYFIPRDVSFKKKLFNSYIPKNCNCVYLLAYPMIYGSVIVFSLPDPSALRIKINEIFELKIL